LAWVVCFVKKQKRALGGDPASFRAKTCSDARASLDRFLCQCQVLCVTPLLATLTGCKTPCLSSSSSSSSSSKKRKKKQQQNKKRQKEHSTSCPSVGTTARAAATQRGRKSSSRTKRGRKNTAQAALQLAQRQEQPQREEAERAAVAAVREDHITKQGV